jgi:hypothetical protein
MINYKVTFLGNHLGRADQPGIEPFEVSAKDVDHLAELIYDRATERLLSNVIEVVIDDHIQHGWVTVGGWRTVGEFDIKIISQSVADHEANGLGYYGGVRQGDDHEG